MEISRPIEPGQSIITFLLYGGRILTIRSFAFQSNLQEQENPCYSLSI